MEKRPVKREKDGSISMDMISQLPQPILHHVLSFLSQKEAIQTCVLSRSWRYLGSTRPKIEFREECFNGNKEKFLSVLDEALLRYQNLSVEEFIVWMWMLDSKSVSLLNKWIPILIPNKGVKKFHLCFHSQRSAYFDLPSIVFQSESLENLHLERCRLEKKRIGSVLLKHLHTLCLDRVSIADETFQMILSGCPSIENVSLFGCLWLRTIKVNKSRNLKHFSFNDIYELYKKEDPHLSIEIDVPTIMTIKIVGCPNWRLHRKNYPRLKSLFLNRVRLSSKSFHFFSSKYLPSLECLTLDSCYGFEEFYLYLSGSVKHLIFRNLKDKYIKAAIHAPSIVEFVYEGEIPQLAVSFKTYSLDWKSNIILSSYADFDNDPSWFDKLSDLLRALSESEITLKLVHHRRRNQPNIQDIPPALLLPNVIYEPVVVEHLSLRGYYSSSWFPAFLNCLLCVCHPRYIGQYLYASAGTEWEREDKELNESLLEILLMKTEMRQYFWPQDLEEVSMVEALDENGQESHPVQVEKACFRLRWRELC